MSCYATISPVSVSMVLAAVRGFASSFYSSCPSHQERSRFSRRCPLLSVSVSYFAGLQHQPFFWFDLSGNCTWAALETGRGPTDRDVLFQHLHYSIWRSSKPLDTSTAACHVIEADSGWINVDWKACSQLYRWVMLSNSWDWWDQRRSLHLLSCLDNNWSREA